MTVVNKEAPEEARDEVKQNPSKVDPQPSLHDMGQSFPEAGRQKDALLLQWAMATYTTFHLLIRWTLNSGGQ
ncbi:hypothetical protein V6N13_137626 [Hibiscus sabdariffa]|uniref:Uncharacterized protein n=1 Tax=Hibiscus sabdariffa TaxID=183260 RepID=A0ABR2DK30_9ROSI